MPEQYIGNYRITSTLGEGGMGVVYAAEHKLLGRPAAIKVLLPRYSNNPQIVDRFFNEAKAATAIRHPGIIEIYDFGYQDDGSAYIAMEFLEGEDLEARLRRLGKLPVMQAIQLASQIASALASAHEHGIIHRDLKPANVFIVPDPQVIGGERIKLLDFGIAKVSLGEGEAEGGRTRAGVVMGTPAYMAPEQCLGAASVDARADLYSVGCILFEMVCGRPPFPGKSSMDVMKAQLREHPPRPSELEPSVSAELESIILYLMAKDAAHRYQRAADLELALKALMPASPSLPSVNFGQASADADEDGAAPLWRRLVMPLAVVVTIAIGGAAFLLLTGRDEAGREAPAVVVADARPAAPDAQPEKSPPPPLVFCADDGRACAVDATDEPVVTWRLRSRPPRAQVLYQGESKGETPLLVKVARDAERTEMLRLRLYDHVDEELELRADEDQDELVELVANIKITLFSRPEGAIIYDEATGEGIGATPGELGVAPGTEPVRFVLRHPGYGDEVVEVIPQRNQTRRITMKRLVTVRLESSPERAEVWKDGARVGQTPFEDQVPQAREETVYELRRDGYETARVSLRPRRNETRRVALEPLPDAKEEGQ